jgi:uncharacterized membrane protein
VRLAQRIPVHIYLDQVPPDVILVAGILAARIRRTFCPGRYEARWCIVGRVSAIVAGQGWPGERGSCSFGVEMISPMHRRRHWYHPRSIAGSLAIRPRLYLSALAGLAALVLLPRGWPAGVREAVAWDLFAAIYLVLAFNVMMTCKGAALRARAARQDDSRTVILVIILLAITASFVAIAGLLAAAKETPSKALNLGLAASTIVLAWTVTQVVFTLHYAHEYYRPTDGSNGVAEGLDFGNDRNPDYWDFFYFATSFGAASQTSDVTILTKPLRRLATLHAIISFFFNTAVLALSINIAASLI